MPKTLLLMTLIAAILIPLPAQAQDPHRAGLVIQFPDGQVETACIEFFENEIAGVELLNRAGLLVSLDYSSGLGVKVCQIGETGCDYPVEDCWCKCQGTPCAYWNYWQIKDGQWIYSPLGAGSRRLGNGDVDGWVWGDGQQPPPMISLDEICQAESGSAEAPNLIFTSPLDTPAVRLTATSPASSLPPPSVTTQPSASPTSAPATQVFVPVTSGEPPAPRDAPSSLPPSSDRYVGFAGVLALLGFIALIVWRRRTGV